MKKRVLALAVALVLSLGLTLLPASAGDSYQVRYKDAAEVLWEMGLFQGNGTSFALDKSLDRASGITMLVRVLGKDAEAKAGQWTTPFTDVPDWAKPYVGYAYVNGLTTGTGADTFSPSANMNAKQFLTLMLRALGYDDKAGDFSYMEAEKKALEVGLIGDSCYTEYTTTDDFRRDNAAEISAVALWLNTKGTDTLLKDTIALPGKPQGAVPYATDAEAEAAKGSSGSQTQGGAYPYKDTQGRERYRVAVNGVLTGGDAYKGTYGILYAPVEAVVTALGYTYTYNEAEEKLTIRISDSQTNAISVSGGTLERYDGLLYTQASTLTTIFSGLNAELSSDKTTLNIWRGGSSAPQVPEDTGSGSSSGSQTAGSQICSTCGGSGRVFCVFCAGSGQKAQSGVRYNPLTGMMEPYTSYLPCSSCGGSGRTLCTSCGGSGHR